MCQFHKYYFCSKFCSFLFSGIDCLHFQSLEIDLFILKILKKNTFMIRYRDKMSLIIDKPIYIAVINQY